MPDVPPSSAPTRAGAVPVETSPPAGRQAWADTGHLVSPLYLPHLEAVHEARGHVQEQLSTVGLGACAQDAGLLVCELAANAVLHARTPFTLHLRPTLEGGVRVEVHDESPLPPVLTASTATSTSGRGLHLVASMATRWGSHPVLPGRGADVEPAVVLGKIVWFELDAGPVATSERRPPTALPVALAPPPVAPSRVAPSRVAPPPVAPPPVASPPTGTIVSAAPAPEDLRHVVVPDLPVVDLLAAEEAVDDLLREFQLLLLGSCSTAPRELPPDVPAPAGPSRAGARSLRSSRPARAGSEEQLLVAAQLDRAARAHEQARRQVRGQLARAVARGESAVTLHLLLAPSAGRVAQRYREALGAAEDLDATRLPAVGDRWLQAVVQQLPSERA